MVICQPYQADHKDNWNGFIETCKTPLFFFKREFVEYHSDRFIDASLMFYQQDRLIAVFPASKHDEILISHGGLTYGGLLLSDKLRSDVVGEIVHSLAKHAWDNGYHKILYKAIPYLFYTQGAQEDLYFLVNRLGARIFRRDLSSVIYLDNRMKLSKGRKWLIARAKKSGLNVTNSQDWANFHDLLCTVLSRHGTAPVHSMEELEKLSQLFPANIQLKVVEKNNTLLAATLLFKFNSTVHTQYLATNEEGKELGALDFLVENCIEESKQNGFKYFSFGISTEEQGKVLNEGLIAQKESFGARGLVLDAYEVNLNDKFS
ncbi:GNAT family N-acetyltransferase [Legionella israelensis]|uniref:GNAT family N-acetyltransferase n=1 Tax=Legionella israelensis TaxID=454 RepID=UPI00117D8782|nr:GNAT family N-acetyltransferase [Legionella israelensis]QDP72346.1 GNAT family N-acetyltransferase [Legionella israelensis]